MSSILYPYETIENGIKLAVEVDGESIDSTRLPIEKKYTDIKVRVVALLPGKWKTLFCAAEQSSTPSIVGFEKLHIAGRRRETEPMQKVKATTFEHTFTLQPADQRGVVEFQATLSRALDATKPESGKATDKAARLTWSDPHQLVFDDRKVKGGFIEVVWSKFDEATDVKASFDGSMFCLDVNHTYPVLHLNRGSDHLQVLFDAKDGTNEAKERDLAFAQIATSVWSELLENALLDLQASVIDQSVPANFEDISDWQQGILTDWLPDLFPDLPAEDAMERLVAEVTNTTFFQELVGIRVPLAAQQRMSVRDQLEKFANRVLTNG